MTVVCGRQGIGKSTLFRRIGMDWFSDSLRTFEGKESAELLQGVWIVEVGELEAMGKAGVQTIKQFLVKEDDQYRAAYARTTEKHLRKCVFFGTTNDHDYLKDPTGNRRFWPVDAEAQPPVKSVFSDLTEDVVGQIWAEAYLRWQLGEPLILSRELEVEAEKRRDLHMERDVLQGQIEEFLEQPVPKDWLRWSLDRRLLYYGGGATGTLELVPRDRVCAAEIWRECMGERRTMNRADAQRINAILSKLPGWGDQKLQRFGPSYGNQRGFLKNPVNIRMLTEPQKVVAANLVQIPSSDSVNIRDS
jgi:hypothetical protein